ncbi:unnamed protein product [Ophioblennius macclurei]
MKVCVEPLADTA